MPSQEDNTADGDYWAHWLSPSINAMINQANNFGALASNLCPSYFVEEVSEVTEEQYNSLALREDLDNKKTSLKNE